jgi:hypothetical protein
MRKLHELYCKHLAKKLKRRKFYLYEATIYYNDGRIETILRDYYTQCSKKYFLNSNILHDNKVLYEKSDNTFIPLHNIKQIQVNIKDEQYVWYVDFDMLDWYMTLQEINDWNNDNKLKEILKYKNMEE